MVIDENDALQLFNGIETMPEEMRPRAASLLADYRTQQEEAGAPLWPTQERVKQDRKKRVQDVFQNPLLLDEDNGAFIEANKSKPGFGDKLRVREASILWLADRYDTAEEDVRKRYDFYKADQSQKWGVQSLDDPAFFSRAKAENDAEIVRTDKRKQAVLTGWESAISGATMPSELARFQESYPGATEDEKLTFADALFQSSVKVLPYRELVKEASGTLSKEMESALPTTDAFQKVADSLLTVPIKDRPMVIKLIGAAGGATPKERASYLSKLAGAMGRITETIGASVAGSMTEAAFSESATSLREAGNFGFAKEMEGEADKQGQYRILTQMIRQTADQEINPIKGDGWWGQLGIDVARMIPQTAITIANPAVGFGANLTYFQDTQAAQAMMEDQSLTYKQAQSITALSAPVSAAAETLSALIPFGKVKLPFLSKWTHAATTSTGGFLRKYGVRSAAGTATEIVEEYIQAAAPLISQELLGVLSADMPDVDWESRMPDFSKIAEQTWAPALVFSLVGAGATSMMDVKNGRTLASDLDLMVATGIKPELAEKIKTASDAGNWSQVDGLFREDFIAQEDKRLAPTTRTESDFANPDENYRIVTGDTAFEDIVNSGLVRTNADSKGGVTLADKIKARPTAFPSFSKGSASMAYAKENPNHYIITTTDPSLQPSTSGRHSKGKTMFPTDADGNHQTSLDAKNVDVWKHVGEGKYEMVYSKGKVVSTSYGKATTEERTQATTRLTDRVRAMTAADKVNWDSPDYTVSVTRGASGWRVETGDGQTIPVDSAEAARRIAVDLRQVGSQQEADALVGIIDNYHAKDAKAETVLTGEDVLGSNTSVTAIRDGKERPLDANALETIRKEAENIGIQTGTEDIFAHVNGSNIVFANKVGKDAKEVIKILNLYQSQKGGQPQVVTFLHESIESNFALGLKTGAINEAEVRQAFAALAPALDPARVRKGQDLERKLYENVRTLAAGGGDATMLRETFSELAVRDAFARDRSNKTAGSVGSISRAIEAAVMGAKTQEEATFLVRFRAMLKAFSTYLKGVLRTVGEIKRGREKGLIGEEWDAFVDKVTGMDETKLLEHQAAEQAVKDVQAAGNMAFSVGPLTPEQKKEFTVEAYHGTDSKRFDEFDAIKLASGSGNEGLFSSGFYFAPNKGGATDYGKNMVTVRLRVKNPLVVPDSFPVMMSGADSEEYWHRFDSEMRVALKSVFTANNFNDVDRIDDVKMDESFVGSFERSYKALTGMNLSPSKSAEVSAKLIQLAGFDAVYAVDDKGDTTEIVIHDPKNIIIEKFNGEPVSGPSFSISAITPAQDSEYLAAVERGDLAKAQAMVDEAAKAAGYTEKRYHGTGESFDVFEHIGTTRADHPESLMGWFFTPDEEVAAAFARQQPQRGNDPLATKWTSVGFASKNGRVIEAYLKLRNTLPIKSNIKLAGAIYAIQDGQNVNEVISDLLPKQEVTELPEGYSVVGGKYKSGSEWWGVKTPKGDTIAVVRTSAEDAVSRGIAEINYSNRIDDRLFTLGLKGRNEKRSAKTLAKAAEILRSGLINKSYDSVSIANDGEGRFIAKDTTVALLPEAIKSADPVTRDESGQVIPLSQRFNPESPDIRFSVSAITNLEEVQEAIYQRMTQRPEEALRVWSNATRKIQKLIQRNRDGGWTWDGKRIRPISDKRTVKSLDKEQAMREATRESELIDEGLATLTPETMLAYSEGVGTLEDDPLIAKMLHDNGKLMSKSTAVAQGKKIEDLYEDAGWIPPSWYARGGGIMPGVMANNLGFDTASEMWAALESSIKSHRSAKEGYVKAEKAVRDVEKAAKEQAKEEAQAWRNEAEAMQAEDWNPREAMIRDLVAFEAILSTMPKEIRGQLSGGFVALARKGSEAGRGKVIKKKVEKMAVLLEKHFKDELGKAVVKLFDKYRPERKAGEKPKGKLDPEAQEIADAAEKAMNLSAAETVAELAKLDALLADDAITPEQETKLEITRELVQLMGDWKNADAARRESAFMALRDVVLEGWAKWKLAQILKREEREAMRQTLRAATKRKGAKIERDKMGKEAAKVLGKAARYLLNLSSFGDVMTNIFGEAEARRFVDRERNSSNQYEDAIQDMSERIDEFFTTLGNGVLRGEQMRFDMAQPTLEIGKGGLNERNISELQGIQALLMWQQEDGKRHMEGPRDENGAAIPDKWSYDQAWIDELTGKLSPEALQVKAFLESLYGAEYAPLNAIYRERHGVNLPRHDRYAPITVAPQQAKAGEMVDPVSGAAVSGSILTPGALRSRNRSALAEPRFQDALATFIGHTKQMEHWKSYYDLAVEMQAIFGNRDVKNSIEASVGEEGSAVLGKWIDTFAQGGTRDAAAGLAISKGLGALAGRVATVGLLGRFSTLLVQSTQLAAISVKMPTGSYLKRFALLMSGNLQWGDAIRSEFIQRRIKTAPPLVQQATKRLGEASRPNQIKRAVRFLGNLLSGADGLFTAGTYAIALDYHRTMGAKMGLSGEALESHAHAEAVNATEQVAQPIRTGTRSIIEVTNTNPLAKMSWAYASEARQKMALFAWATHNAKADPAGAAKTAFLVFVIGGLMSQVLKNLWREAKGDDDEKKWSPARLTLAMMSPITSAIPGASMLAGEGGSLSGAKYAQYSLKDLFDGDADMKDVDTLLSVAGYFNDTAAGIATLSHAGYDFAQILDNAFGED